MYTLKSRTTSTHSTRSASESIRTDTESVATLLDCYKQTIDSFPLSHSKKSMAARRVALIEECFTRSTNHSIQSVITYFVGISTQADNVMLQTTQTKQSVIFKRENDEPFNIATIYNMLLHKKEFRIETGLPDYFSAGQSFSTSSPVRQAHHLSFGSHTASSFDDGTLTDTREGTFNVTISDSAFFCAHYLLSSIPQSLLSPEVSLSILKLFHRPFHHEAIYAFQQATETMVERPILQSELLEEFNTLFPDLMTSQAASALETHRAKTQLQLETIRTLLQKSSIFTMAQRIASSPPTQCDALLVSLFDRLRQQVLQTKDLAIEDMITQVNSTLAATLVDITALASEVYISIEPRRTTLADSDEDTGEDEAQLLNQVIASETEMETRHLGAASGRSDDANHALSLFDADYRPKQIFDMYQTLQNLYGADQQRTLLTLTHQPLFYDVLDSLKLAPGHELIKNVVNIIIAEATQNLGAALPSDAALQDTFFYFPLVTLFQKLAQITPIDYSSQSAFIHEQYRSSPQDFFEKMALRVLGHAPDETLRAIFIAVLKETDTALGELDRPKYHALIENCPSILQNARIFKAQFSGESYAPASVEDRIEIIPDEDEGDTPRIKLQSTALTSPSQALYAEAAKLFGIFTHPAGAQKGFDQLLKQAVTNFFPDSSFKKELMQALSANGINEEDQSEYADTLFIAFLNGIIKNPAALEKVQAAIQQQLQHMARTDSDPFITVNYLPSQIKNVIEAYLFQYSSSHQHARLGKSCAKGLIFTLIGLSLAGSSLLSWRLVEGDQISGVNVEHSANYTLIFAASALAAGIGTLDYTLRRKYLTLVTVELSAHYRNLDRAVTAGCCSAMGIPRNQAIAYAIYAMVTAGLVSIGSQDYLYTSLVKLEDLDPTEFHRPLAITALTLFSAGLGALTLAPSLAIRLWDSFKTYRTPQPVVEPETPGTSLLSADALAQPSYHEENGIYCGSAQALASHLVETPTINRLNPPAALQAAIDSRNPHLPAPGNPWRSINSSNVSAGAAAGSTGYNP